MSWLAVTLPASPEQAECLSDTLMENGALSVSIEDAAAGTLAEQPVFGEPGSPQHPALWQTCSISCLLAADADVPALLTHVAALCDYPLLHYSVSTVAEQDWVRASQAEFAPICIADRLWIVPTWHELPDPAAIHIRLDPGLAFGTGSHATTRLCLEWLATNLFKGESVLDYGCGSGILAIAAAKLGAQHVMGIDIDPQAVTTAVDNARDNDVSPAFVLPDTDPGGQYDVVLANILTNPLISLAPLIGARCRIGGRLVLSGILREQTEQICSAYASQFELELWDEAESWVCLTGTRRM